MRFWRRRRAEDPLVCREFVELVTDYLEGSLPRETRTRFEAHLAECEVCELLDITDGNQRVLLHRARTRVRLALAPLMEVTR